MVTSILLEQNKTSRRGWIDVMTTFHNQNICCYAMASKQ